VNTPVSISWVCIHRMPKEMHYLWWYLEEIQQNLDLVSPKSKPTLSFIHRTWMGTTYHLSGRCQNQLYFFVTSSGSEKFWVSFTAIIHGHQRLVMYMEQLKLDPKVWMTENLGLPILQNHTVRDNSSNDADYGRAVRVGCCLQAAKLLRDGTCQRWWNGNFGTELGMPQVISILLVNQTPKREDQGTQMKSGGRQDWISQWRI